MREETAEQILEAMARQDSSDLELSDDETEDPTVVVSGVALDPPDDGKFSIPHF